MPYSILIVDDEQLNRNYLRDLITEIEPTATIFEAASAVEARPILENEIIDILFSDIKMPDEDGFEMLKSLSHRNFDLVFVTAYAQFAIQAIKEGAADYILKPIKKDEFKATFEKLAQKRYNELTRNIVSNIQADYLSNRLAVGHQQGIKFIMLKDIVYLEANNTYTTIVLGSGEKITTSKPISKFENKLSAHWFFRVHKSHIINIHHFKEYISRDGDIALMSNGDKIYISRYRLNDFLNAVDNTSGRLKI